jgi:CHAD domain-containing protein
MALDRKRIQKSARKLRKLLRKMPSPPAPEEVHSFRTNARRLETVLEAFSLDNTKDGAALSKQISKLRRRAGKVRDLNPRSRKVPRRRKNPNLLTKKRVR